MKDPQMLENTHVLKIVLKGKAYAPRGIICHPMQTYGISGQSPDYFNSSHGFKAENGYLYEQQQQRNNKELFLPPFSQQKYSSVVGNTIDVVGNFPEQFQKQLSKNSERHHRRKGRLSDFMDKNGWMNNTYKMMGFQRSDEAREASNKDRQRKIQTARRLVDYINPVQKKVQVTKDKSINSKLISEKAKIRFQRFSLRKQKQESLNIQKLMVITSKKSPQKDPYIDCQALTNKMSKTANEKQWKQTMQRVRRKFRKNDNRLSMTRSDWSTNNQSLQLKIEEIDKRGKDQLNQWFNTTCNSKADPWSYRKGKKVGTGSDEDIFD